MNEQDKALIGHLSTKFSMSLGLRWPLPAPSGATDQFLPNFRFANKLLSPHWLVYLARRGSGIIGETSTPDGKRRRGSVCTSIEGYSSGMGPIS